MHIVLWRGFHSPSLLEILEPALAGKLLAILCPPHLSDYQFVNFLPKGEITLAGEWESAEQERAWAQISVRTSENYPELPHVGVFSSGTVSAIPSLIMFRREAAEYSLQSILDLFEPAWAEKIICYPQPFHIFGLTLGYVHSLLWKKPLLTPDGRYQKSFHDRWLKADRQGVLTLGVPVHFFDLLERTPQALLPQKSSAICGGARVSPDLWMKFQQHLGIAYPSIGYGATEACPGLAHLPPGVPPREPGDIGQWLRGVEVVRHETGFEFRGPNQCLAIVDESAPGKFALRFPRSIHIRDEIATSGDRLIFKTRSDLRMNRGGEKYSLELIEERVQTVLGVPALASTLLDPRLGEKLGLCLQHPTEDPIAMATLRQRCKELIAREYAWVVQDSEMQILDKIPTTPNGKYLRPART